MSARDTAPVLSVQNLVVVLDTPSGVVRVIDHVSFDVYPREVLGIVGESGSGKSMTMLAVMGLLPPGVARIVGGSILLGGRNLVDLPAAQLRLLRGNELSIIFQDPMTSFNPVKRIGTQIGEVIRIHRPQMKQSAVRDRVIELLTLVGIPEPAQRYRQFPLEFSGGMRQRAMIAVAIANEPSLLIADEPTTALDVTIQAQVMEVLAEVRERTGAAMVLITHDLGLVAELADRVAVMYAGRILESATVRALFHEPRHPYSMGLLASQPGLDSASSDLYAIPGQPPDVQRRPAGCVFSPRCEMRAGRAVCVEAVPPLNDLSDDHKVACHFADEAANWRATGSAMPLPHG